MSRSAEDILLQVPHVKYKKNEGTLYVMGERIAWMMANKRDSFSIIHKYADVKTQKISPEGKAKIQLQVVLHDGNSTTFQFIHPEGLNHQLKSREDVKELLLQLLPKFKKKVNKELEEKNRMLSENKGLLQLYKDLVITGILTAEEFWVQHAKKPSPSSSSAGGGGGKDGLGVGSIKDGKQVQDVGVSGSFLSDIKPQADGANGLKYNLTNDIIQSIFKTYPAVKRKHLENVPSKMSEHEFWTKFFQSHYFHRDRLHGQVKDIFDACAKDDESRIKAQLKEGSVLAREPVANLDNFHDNTNDEHFGNVVQSSGQSSKSNNVVHQNIIKRFNRHSIMVMNVSDGTTASSSSSKDSVSNSNGSSTQKKDQKNSQPSPQEPQPSSETPCPPVSVSKKRLLEKTQYEDLGDTGPIVKKVALNLAKTDRYLNGPTPAGSGGLLSGNALNVDLNINDVNNWKRGYLQALTKWSQEGDCREMLSARAAVSALNDLSPGGALMKGARQELMAEQYPDSVIKDLKLLYGSLSELLRHFWACFPPTTPQLQEKLAKMHDTLKKFQHVKVRPFENELLRTYTSGPKITVHLNQMLALADKKYTIWQQKFNNPKR